MREIFVELLMYLQNNVDSYFWDGDFCRDSLASEVMAFASMIEERFQ